MQGLWCYPALDQYHTLSPRLQNCVKSLQHWQEGPHYIGTLMTINEWKMLGRCLSHPRGKGLARTEAVFHVLLQLLGSSSLMLPMITYHSLSHRLWLTFWPVKVTQGHGSYGKSVEKREEGMFPQTLNAGQFGVILIFALYQMRRRIWSSICV